MNDTLLGATTSVVQYDGSGVFQPNRPANTIPTGPVVVAAPADGGGASSGANSSETVDPNLGAEEANNTGTKNLLMYAGAALLLYFFVFKKK